VNVEHVYHQKTIIYYIYILEPVMCTLCGDGNTCVILSANSYECRPPLGKFYYNLP
jgi:hypothetical protein